MLVEALRVDRATFEAGSGWQLKPEGACKGEVCIPLKQDPGDPLAIDALAREMGLPLVAEPDYGLWAVGPASHGGRALTTAEAPDLKLPDLAGNEFRLSSLRGSKVLVYAWAPY